MSSFGSSSRGVLCPDFTLSFLGSDLLSSDGKPWWDLYLEANLPLPLFLSREFLAEKVADSVFTALSVFGDVGFFDALF